MSTLIGGTLPDSITAGKLVGWSLAVFFFFGRASMPVGRGEATRGGGGVVARAFGLGVDSGAAKDPTSDPGAGGLGKGGAAGGGGPWD